MHRFRKLALVALPVLLLTIGSLTAMAYASPPDPSWIKGVYDDADFDDVVVLITSGSGAVELAPVAELQPLLVAVTPVVESVTGPVPTPSLESAQPRAPPVH